MIAVKKFNYIYYLMYNNIIENKDDYIQKLTANDERINGLKQYVNCDKQDLLALKPKADWNRSDIERDTAVDDLVFSDKNSIFSEEIGTD